MTKSYKKSHCKTFFSSFFFFAICICDEAHSSFPFKQISTDLTCCVSSSLLVDSDESPVARERTIIVHANHNQLSLCEEDLSIGGHLHRTRDSGCQTDDFLIACMSLRMIGKFVICLQFRGPNLEISCLFFLFV